MITLGRSFRSFISLGVHTFPISGDEWCVLAGEMDEGIGPAPPFFVLVIKEILQELGLSHFSSSPEHDGHVIRGLVMTPDRETEVRENLQDQDSCKKSAARAAGMRSMSVVIFSRSTGA